MRATRGHGARSTFAVLAAVALLVSGTFALSACASRDGAREAAARGLVQRDRQLARTPDQIDFDRPAWSRDWTPAADP